MRPELYIDGAWRRGRAPVFSSIDPATDDPVWTGHAASVEDVAEAFAAARAAFPDWSLRPGAERIEIARRFGDLVAARAEEFAVAIRREMGKPAWEAKGEVQTMVGKVALSIRAMAERAGEREEAAAFGALRLQHRPHGVMAVFGPFNFPGHLPNGHVVPALLAGDTVVFKPSEITPGVGALMAQAWADAGLPAGVLNLVQGGRDVGGALLEGDVNGVLFTGSAATGAHIHRYFAGRPDIILALEMGGNNPLIAWPSGEPTTIANLIVHSAFLTTGQRCSCARRLILPDDDWGRAVLDALVGVSEGVRIGAGDAVPAPFMGPLATRQAAQAARTFEAKLASLGGAVLRGVGGEGAFVRPGVVDMRAAAPAPDEELFGPLLQVQWATSLDAAITMANATRFGLAGGLLSGDPEVWDHVSARLRAGVLNWNRPTTGASGALPFGGPGLSGNGRPSAYYAADYCAYPVAQQIAPALVALPAEGLPA